MQAAVNLGLKKINTDAIKGILIQGEESAVRVEFTLPFTNDDVDFRTLNYQIRAVNMDAGTTALQTLTKTVGETTVTLAWDVTEAFTARAGKLLLWLVGSDEAGDMVIKFDGEAVYVRGDLSIAMSDATQTALEQLAAQINYQIAHMQVVRILGTYATLSALTAAVTDAQKGDMYNVGSSTPYTVYVWTGEWTSLGVLAAQGLPGEDGIDGVDGTNGAGVPAGGATNDYYAKKSATDYDGEFRTPDGTPTADSVKLLTSGGAKTALDAKADLVSSKVKADQASSDIVEFTDSATLALSNAGKFIKANKATAMTITIPTNATVAFPVGTEIEVFRYGAGTVQFAVQSGVTLRSSGSATYIAAQYTSATLKKIGTDEWALIGGIS